MLGDTRALASWPPVGGGEGAVLLGPVVADRVDLDDPSGDRQLHGVADQGDLDLLATVGPAGVEEEVEVDRLATSAAADLIEI